MLLLGDFDASSEINGQRKEFCGHELSIIFWGEIYCVKFALIGCRFLLLLFQRNKLKVMLDECDAIFVEELGLCKGIIARINMKSDATPTFR